MNRFLFFVVICLLTANANAQDGYLSRKEIDRRADSIAIEGKALYSSEWASWYGTDIFLEKFKNKRSLIGGYLSYETKEAIKNVFFGKGENPDVLATIAFGKGFNPQQFQLDTAYRKLKKNEMELFTIRRIALERLRQDTIFKFFNNVDMNVVPLIRNGYKRVYILSAPKVNGMVLYGNDYLVDYDKNNEIVAVKRIHNSLISANAGSNADSSKVVLEYYHTHVPGKEEFMTATDICTTMLYEHLTTWNLSMIASKKYISMWDCKKNMLVVLTMDERGIPG
jgi:hypothetical protein